MAVIITTTNKISYYTIKEYRGMVCANQVFGADFISDLLASWTDFLGGKSGAYRNQLDDLFSDIKSQMVVKAEELGANAILGMRLSFNEISGKNKSMFMMSGYGTAALIEPDIIERMEKVHKLNVYLSEGLLTEEEYNNEKQKLSELYDNFIYESESHLKADLASELDTEQEEDSQDFDGFGNIWKLSVDGIKEAQVPFKLKGNSNEEVLRNLLQEELYNEAGKFYMQYSHANVEEAYEYIFSIIMKET